MDPTLKALKALKVLDPPPGKYNRKFWAKFRSGEWEPETLAFVRAMATPLTTFVDIGSWVGPVALVAAAAGYRSVAAFEPDPVAWHHLKYNVRQAPTVAVHHMAVVANLAAAVDMSLHTDGEFGDSATSLQAGGQPGGLGLAIPAAVDARGALCRAGTAGPLVVKVDVEGYEYELLPSLLAALPRGTSLHLSAHPKFQPGKSVEECIMRPLRRARFRSLTVTGDVSDLFTVACVAKGRPADPPWPER